LLDLFCGAGGCTKGYQEAGFYVVGVDLKPQPNYCGDAFFQTDALDVLEALVEERQVDWLWPSALTNLAAVHASPPCQAYTSMRHFGKGAGEGAPELIEPTRELLIATGLPYVIENVPTAPLISPYKLCGSSFGLNVWRHRLFETNFPMMSPGCAHFLAPKPIAVYGDHPQTPGEKGTRRVRRARSLKEGQDAMGIDWMPWKELTQAIPPAMTEHIGGYLLAHIEAERKVAA
jgi:DNA (cytosine-5)-methyltransferase 1